MGSLSANVRRPLARVMSAWGAEGGDGVLYGLSAGFALATGVFAGLPSYRLWAWIAMGPYLAAASASLLVGRHRSGVASAGTAATDPQRGQPGQARHGTQDAALRQWGPARVWMLLLVLMGAVLVPLGAEVALRSPGGIMTHVQPQPEAVVIAQAAGRLGQGEDPYHTTVVHDRVESAVPGEPTFESFFPYLPLMAAFGLPGSRQGQVQVTDTRVMFSIVTLLVVGAALLALRAPRNHKIRALQFLTVLPTAALPLATGGDDLPIVAFLLLAMVLAQRRRPGWSGLVFGLVSAMKFTAWPLSVLALFCARDKNGRRAPGRMLLGMLAVAGPVVAPFVVMNARAFFDNVVLFPLGLSGVTSPAASNLPGHVLVSALPWLHTVLPVTVAAVGGLLLLRHLVRRTPSTPAAVATVAGWVMLVAIAFAPSSRVGYLLYPADFFVWGWMFAAADRAGEAAVADGALVPVPELLLS